MSLPNTRPASSALSVAARAAIVNRTRRVVRERAMTMQQRKRSRRELVLPLLICSAVLLLVCYAGWVVASGTGFGAVGSEIGQEAGRLTGQTMDTGSPAFLLLLWFLPITIATAAVVYLRRKRGSRDRGRDVFAPQLDGRFRDEVIR